MSRNEAFDRLKGVSAVLVVLIHAPPFLHSAIPAIAFVGWLISCICLCAVPYFFILSGKFAASRWPESGPSRVALGRASGRLLRLYIPWFVLYLVLDFALARPTDSLTVWRRLVGFSDGSMDTTAYHLWFLPTLLLAHLIAGASRMVFKTILPCLIFSISLLSILAILDFNRIKLPFHLPTNEGLNLSLVGFCLGAYLSENEGQMKRQIRPVWIVAAFAMLLGEAGIWAITRNSLYAPPFVFSRFLVPALLVMYAAQNSSFLNSGTLGKILDALGQYSTGIYVLHLSFLYLIPFERLVPNGFIRDNFVRWTVSLGCAILVTMVLRKFRSPFIKSMIT